MVTSKESSVKKPAVKKPVVKKAVTTKTSTAKKSANKLTAEARYNMVQVAAYYLAEKDAFGGNNLEYWIAAEAEINQHLTQ
jgi:Protein of unknown function (DUF2934)